MTDCASSRKLLPIAAWLVCGFAVTFLTLFGQSPTAGDTPLQNLIQQAESLRGELKWDEAISLLRQVVARRGEDEALAAKAQVRIGKMLIDANRVDEAPVELSAVMNDFANRPRAVKRARVFLIEVAQRRGELTKADTDARQLLADSAGDPEFQIWARTKLAEIKVSQGRQLETLSELEGIVADAQASFPEPCNWARVLMLNVLSEKYMPQRALDVADAIVPDHATGRSSDEQLATALIWKGRTFLKQNDFASARDALFTALALAGSSHPYMAHECRHELGHVFRREAEDTSQSQLHEQALTHYLAARDIAKLHQLGVGRVTRNTVLIAKELVSLGMRNRAIATLRKEIGNPASLGSSGRVLAGAVAELLPTEQAARWHDYLANPGVVADPTAVMVQTEFGESPSPPTGPVTDLFIRHYWRARLADRERYYEQAAQLYQAAFDAGANPGEKGEALTGLTRIVLRTQGKASAIAVAEQAAAIWRDEAVRSTYEGNTHYAVDMLMKSYEHAGHRERGIAALEQLVTTISATERPAEACYLRTRLTGEFAEQQDWAKARALAEETLGLFLDHPFAKTHAQQCGSLLLLLSSVCVQQRDFACAEQAIATLASRWPIQFADRIASHRRLIQEVMAADDQEEE